MNNATSEDYLRNEAQRDLDQWKKDTKFQPSTGCWVDDRWGIYAMTRVIEIAQDYGFEIADDDRIAVDVYRNGGETFELDEEIHYASDWVMEICDEAEEWLNDTIAWPGLSFGWFDGEFFYMDDSWWEEL